MRKFVIIIPSYNNEKWCQKNLESVLKQKYKDYRIIYIDDNSTDNTYNLVKDFLSKNDTNKKCKLIKNSVRVGALKNLYDMIHSCDDDEIIVTVDGDDFLAHNNVLTRLDVEYSKPNIWMTYGSYADYPQNSRGCCRPYEQEVIKKNTYRNVPWRASHLRTFYTWLFKKIKQQDFLDNNGQWFDVAWDLSFMLALLELSGGNHSYIHDILYLYNNQNPISDYKIKLNRQGMFDRLIRTRQKYSKIEK